MAVLHDVKSNATGKNAGGLPGLGSFRVIKITAPSSLIPIKDA